MLGNMFAYDDLNGWRLLPAPDRDLVYYIEFPFLNQTFEYDMMKVAIAGYNVLLVLEITSLSKTSRYRLR